MIRAAAVAGFLGASALGLLCQRNDVGEARFSPSRRQSLVVARPAPNGDDSTVGRLLHVVEVKAADSSDWLAFFMSGDGGWVAADHRLAQQLAKHGVSVIGLDSRAYLSHKRSPDETSRDVSRTINTYLAQWKKEQVILIGSSRGADLMPLIANRLPDDLRARVRLIVLFGVSQWASFEFHWSDLVMDTHRPTDLPVLPELERLRGTPTLCIYGTDEKNSLCSSADTTLVRPYAREGGHRLRGDQSVELADIILDARPR
jgi:type IV secretory pathway VirJ component